MEENLLNPKPYERVGSMQFIKFAKKGNFQIVGDMLFINRYHAFDVDHIGQTALHWAAKRGYAEVIVKMFEAGADVDKEDIVKIENFLKTFRVGRLLYILP